MVHALTDVAIECRPFGPIWLRLCRAVNKEAAIRTLRREQVTDVLSILLIELRTRFPALLCPVPVRAHGKRTWLTGLTRHA